MARKSITNTEYTQINTNPASYLIQNISSADVVLVIADTEPSSDADYDFILDPNDGISSSDFEGIVWAKARAKAKVFAGVEISVVEG